MKDKSCRVCSKIFSPTGRAALYCKECAIIKKQESRRRDRLKAYEKWAEKARQEGRGHTVGVGRGGSNKKGSEHKQYKNGIGHFHKVLKKEVKARRYCEVCGKDLFEATIYEWCAHHIDHDRSNNVIENLQLLCKKCHQIEHKCWKAFSKSSKV